MCDPTATASLKRTHAPCVDRFSIRAETHTTAPDWLSHDASTTIITAARGSGVVPLMPFLSAIFLPGSASLPSRNFPSARHLPPLSSRPEWPTLLLRAAVWRVGHGVDRPRQHPMPISIQRHIDDFSPHSSLSSRPKQPDLLFRVAIRRVGLRSGGTTATHKVLLPTLRSATSCERLSTVRMLLLPNSY